MAGCGDRVGALVVAYRVGEQDLAALRDFDVAFGDGERQLIVVLYFVGLKDDGRVLVSVSLAADLQLCKTWRGGEQQREDRGDPSEDRAFGQQSVSRPGGTCHVPSSSRNRVRSYRAKDRWQQSEMGNRAGHPSSR
jgi:hypothetical protein